MWPKSAVKALFEAIKASRKDDLRKKNDTKKIRLLISIKIVENHVRNFSIRWKQYNITKVEICQKS